MKRKIGLIALSLSAILLVSCGNNSTSKVSDKQTSSSTSQKKVETTQKSTETSQPSSETSSSSVSGISIEGIKSGDYTSLVGTWKNLDGDILRFDTNGIVEPSNRELDVSNATVDNDILKANMKFDSYYAAMIMFAPSGTVFPTGIDDQSDTSDSSKDRIMITQQNIYSDPNKFYYKVDSDVETESHKSQSAEEAIKRRDTGVWLSGGQSSVDYANQILGYKDRQVSAGNYGMTDAIPYNTVISKDGQVWVYQNGVIIGVDNQILYEP